MYLRWCRNGAADKLGALGRKRLIPQKLTTEVKEEKDEVWE